LIVLAALDAGLRNWRMRQKSNAALRNSNRRALANERTCNRGLVIAIKPRQRQAKAALHECHARSSLDDGPRKA
jgi:hypothetical protein